MPHVTFRSLFRGASVSIDDYRCRAPHSGSGSEEYAYSHQVVFTRRGVFVKHVGRREVAGEPARVLFFNKDEPYRVSHPGDSGDDCTVISTELSFLREVVSEYEPAAGQRDNPFSISDAETRPDCAAAHRALRFACTHSVAGELDVEEHTIALLCSVLSSAYARPEAPAPTTGTARTRRDLAEATRVFLATQPFVNHSLPEIATALNTSPFHLSRVFSSAMGISIHQHLIRLRLISALEMLPDHDSTLSALATNLGFANHAHFATLFRRAFGASPSEIRRSLRSDRIKELSKNLKARSDFRQ